MTSQRYWFKVVTHRVETNDDPGRRRDRMGPYPTREAAADAPRTARRRNEAWESPLRDRPRPDGWPTTTVPKPLGRSDLFVLRHLRATRVTLVALALLAAAGGIALVAHGQNGSGLILATWYLVWALPSRVPALIERQRRLAELSDAASGAPRGRTPR